MTRHEATYELVDGDQLIIQHFGDKVTVGEKATRQKIPAIQKAPRPRQPKGPRTHNPPRLIRAPVRGSPPDPRHSQRA